LMPMRIPAAKRQRGHIKHINFGPTLGSAQLSTAEDNRETFLRSRRSM
jgi:hypothetical protein